MVLLAPFWNQNDTYENKLFIRNFSDVYGDNHPVSDPLPEEDELTVLIDYKKYLEFQANQSQRIERQMNQPPPGDFQRPPDHPPFVDHPPPLHPLLHHEPPNHYPCLDNEHEVYQQCGSKCVLGCRYATSTSILSIGKHECDKNECVEGCFCKTGLVRHQSKCIPALECPIRKCHHRDEIYVSVNFYQIQCEYETRKKCTKKNLISIIFRGSKI